MVMQLLSHQFSNSLGQYLIPEVWPDRCPAPFDLSVMADVGLVRPLINAKGFHSRCRAMPYRG